MQDALTLIPMTPDHLSAAAALSRAEHWPHRPEDWALTLTLGVGVVAIVDGRVVATAITTPFGADATAVNMIIVDASMRGRGLGRRMMDAVLALVPDREQRLTATRDGLPLYEKLGFVATGEIFQHQGHAMALTGDAPEWTADVNAVVTLDREAFGADRSDLIHELFRVGRVSMSPDGRGFAVVRDFGRGKLIGPVVARTQTQALGLIRAILTTLPNEFVRIDIPEESGLDPQLVEWGLVSVGGGIAMRRNARMRQESSVHTFGLASQALG